MPSLTRTARTTTWGREPAGPAEPRARAIASRSFESPRSRGAAHRHSQHSPALLRPISVDEWTCYVRPLDHTACENEDARLLSRVADQCAHACSTVARAQSATAEPFLWVARRGVPVRGATVKRDSNACACTASSPLTIRPPVPWPTLLCPCPLRARDPRRSSRRCCQTGQIKRERQTAWLRSHTRGPAAAAAAAAARPATVTGWASRRSARPPSRRPPGPPRRTSSRPPSARGTAGATRGPAGWCARSATRFSSSLRPTSWTQWLVRAAATAAAAAATSLRAFVRADEALATAFHAKLPLAHRELCQWHGAPLARALVDPPADHRALGLLARRRATPLAALEPALSPACSEAVVSCAATLLLPCLTATPAGRGRPRSQSPLHRAGERPCLRGA
jgi:hypothetical protein